MQPSRRQLLVAIGSGAALGLAGCVAEGIGGGTPNDTDSTDGNATNSPNGTTEATSPSPEGSLEARLVGPDAEITVFEGSDLVEVGAVEASGDHYVVPVTVSEERGDTFLEAVQDLDLAANHEAYEIVLTLDGEEIRRSPISEGLAHEWDSGAWEQKFVINSPTEEEAERIREALV